MHLENLPVTYGSRALGTKLLAFFRSSAEQLPDSSPKAIPMRFNTSISSWISNALSKLNRYSNLGGAEKEEWVCQYTTVHTFFFKISSKMQFPSWVLKYRAPSLRCHWGHRKLLVVSQIHTSTRGTEPTQAAVSAQLRGEQAQVSCPYAN